MLLALVWEARSPVYTAPYSFILEVFSAVRWVLQMFEICMINKHYVAWIKANTAFARWSIFTWLPSWCVHFESQS